MMAEGPHEAALEALTVFVGEWEIEASLDLDPSLGPARTTFEWALDGRFLLQRANVPHPQAPNLLTVISTDPDSGAYTQHYFDSRGVVRVYEMELTEETWTLLRTKPDFTPLRPFPQRYVGTFEDEGHRIAGRWEKAPDGGTWELDFELSYTNLG
jgi:hypothetical protein